MATTFYSPSNEYSDGCWFRAKCVYSTSSTATQVKVSGTVYLQHKGAALSDALLPFHATAGKCTASEGGFTANVATADAGTVAKHAGWTDVKSKAFSFAVDKGTAAATVYVGAAAGWLNFKAQAGKAVTVPALASYKVAYDANGGSGAPAAQTKYYGKGITLSYMLPTYANHVFRSWNTKADGTGAAYAPGASYTANAAATLHAVWGAVPVISSLAAERCDESGTPDDEGGCALVTCEWSIDGTFGDTASLAGEISTAGSSRAFAFAAGASGTGGTATAVVPDVDPEFKYVVTVTAANGALTTTRSAIISGADFMLDFKAGGGAVGIGCPAPESGLEVAFDADFTGAVCVDSGLSVDGDTSLNGLSLHGKEALPVYEVAAAWSGNGAAFAALLPARPCVALSTDGYELWFDADASTDSY